MPADLWVNRSYLRDVQYRTDANLAARQSMYAYQHPRIDLPGRIVDLAAPSPTDMIADVGCGNGAYLAELIRRGFAGRVIGADLSFGMLEAARRRMRDTRAGLASAATAVETAEAALAETAEATAVETAEATAVETAEAALVAADASALPVRDGCADLMFAMHMLYHVPDPAAAVRELRRVTRPGGRVVVGLNGGDHLRELRAIVDATDVSDARSPGERLRLDDGEVLLGTVFSSVTRHDFIAELRVPDPEPVLDYIRSMARVQALADPGQLVGRVLARFPNTPGRLFRITTHSGCLVCV